MAQGSPKVSLTIPREEAHSMVEEALGRGERILAAAEDVRDEETFTSGRARQRTSVEQVRDATGWVRIADEVVTTDEPTDEELNALRELMSRA